MPTSLAPIAIPPPLKLQVGEEVFVLDSDGNSVVCSPTIHPVMMHKTMPPTADPNSVGKGINPHRFDAPNVFIITRRMQWTPVDERHQVAVGAKIMYQVVPFEGDGQERLVPSRDLLVQVRFKPADLVYYRWKNTNGSRTNVDAIVQAAEVTQNKRTYTIYLPDASALPLVQDDDLIEHPLNKDTNVLMRMHRH